MNNNIKILEKFKQEEISKILKIILNIWKNYIKPEKIILFGDYIKWDFLENNLIKEWDQIVEYKTTIQILIITRKPTQEKNMRLSREVMSSIKNNKSITNSVNIVIEDIFNFNQWINEKRYFYLDIIREWILLYDSSKYKINEVKKLTKKEIKQIQKEDFDNWFSIAKEFLKDYKNAYGRKSYKMAIFYLHQSTELFITCYLLVKSWYKPKTHDLEILYSKLKEESNKFNKWFNLTNENYYFELLKWAYINSRYKKNYIVNKQELDVLFIKVIDLSVIIENLCLNEIKK
jgi:uncharacterized protein